MGVNQEILKAGLAAQSARLAFSNIGKGKKEKLTKKAVNNILGLSLIQSQAQLIGGVD